jgi:hypothetical protein
MDVTVLIVALMVLAFASWKEFWPRLRDRNRYP